ncbi:MAG: winged helix-turn-helix domain-containing protein [Acidimicrobiia bacterium]
MARVSLTEAGDGQCNSAQPAIVLVGQASRDYKRVDTALSANILVILLPSLQTARVFSAPETGHAATASTSTDELFVDLTSRRVLLRGHELPVSGRELVILAVLSEEPGRAHSFAELAAPEGGRWLGDKERVRSAVKRLRKKLSAARADARIESVRGHGFRLVTSSTPIERTKQRP